MYNTLIFDLDGTLVDSIEDLALSTNILMEENHFPTYDLDTYKQFVGNGVDKLIERALPEKYKKDVRKYRARFDEIYKEIMKGSSSRKEFFEQILEVLNTLGGGVNDVR